MALAALALAVSSATSFGAIASSCPTIRSTTSSSACTVGSAVTSGCPDPPDSLAKSRPFTSLTPKRAYAPVGGLLLHQLILLVGPRHADETVDLPVPASQLPFIETRETVLHRAIEILNGVGLSQE